MSATKVPLDSSSKWSLAALAAAIVISVVIIVRSFIEPVSPLRKVDDSVRPTPAQRPPAVEPVLYPAQQAPTAPVFSQSAETPDAAQQKVIHMESVHKQAEYFRQLVAKHSKTASLPTPEQIDEMEKNGLLAQ
ncbi:MAG: hypothetical protein ABSC38_02415 [Verrucomicrobiia bacterium]